ncbi:hypothetical protein FJ492_19925 [Mesorhizobium sp. B2-5-4]|uniref:hypothetical protein n=1 Tax=Mesorhizobium sp. B2-5-4 TaxID=2589926 RepID=UPI00112D47FD|nr:hypothetical protein [Mesorhizobium sp. B2-5-4]TPK41273.1 hypothetical protein FJ492_19925 [Mesorhizobium sp. B2-5-4]
MLIFSRRILQKMINGVADHLSYQEIDRIIQHVDQPKRNGIPYVWELALLWAHIQIHHVVYEWATPSNEKIDIWLPEFGVFSEIKTLSDAQAHKDYPVTYFMDCFSTFILKYAPVHGDFHIQFGSIQKRIDGRLVHVPALPKDVERSAKQLVLELVKIGGDFSQPFQHQVSYQNAWATISYKLARKDFPLIGHGYPVFTTHRQHDRDVDSVVKSHLDKACKQLAGAPPRALKGVYLCDGGSDLWTKGSPLTRTGPVEDIAKRYLRKNPEKLSFIVLFSVDSVGPLYELKPELRFKVVSQDAAIRDLIQRIVTDAIANLSRPIENIGTAFTNRLQGQRRTSMRGALKMSGDRISLPASSVLAILAGRPASELLDDPKALSLRSITELLQHRMREGQLIHDVRLVSGEHRDDDMIEFDLRGPDPAVSPLMNPKRPG